MLPESQTERFLDESILSKVVQKPDNQGLRKMDWAANYNEVVSRLIRGAIIGKRLHLGEPDKGYRDLQAFTNADGAEIQLSRRQKPYFYVPDALVEGWPGSDQELGNLYVVSVKLKCPIFDRGEWGSYDRRDAPIMVVRDGSDLIA